MEPTLIACDLITSKNDKTYLTELCPALSCSKSDLVNLTFTHIISLVAKQNHGLKLIQPPQEPEAHKNLLSHFNIHSESYIKAVQPTKPTAHYAKLGVSNGTSLTRIDKKEFRQYLSNVIRDNERTPHQYWIMYFRNGIHQTEIADKFSLILQKTFKSVKKNITPFGIYPLKYACEQDKVLFWQLLALKKSPMLVPKEIFRLSTFSLQQKTKIADFIKDLPHEKFLIKSTNSTLSSGILVVKREQLIKVASLMAEYIRQNPIGVSPPGLHPIFRMKLPLADQIKNIICPTFSSLLSLEQQLIDIEINKFVNFWCKLDLNSTIGTERDFFLIEAYITPKTDTVDGQSGQIKSAVASRAFLMKPGTAGNPHLISLMAKMAYKTKKLQCDFDFISASKNYYFYHSEAYQQLGEICSHSYERTSDARQNVGQAFVQANAWLNTLLTEKTSAFIQQVVAQNPHNPELQAYLKSPAITDLNVENDGFCWNCFKIKAARYFNQCTGCKTAKYCDATCQKNDWITYHKHECKLIAKV